MERIEVTSSYLYAIRYSHEASILEVELRNGSVYHYTGVPEARYVSLVKADSKGKYFRTHIKDRYPCTRVS